MVRYFALLLLIVNFYACRQSHAPDVSGISVDIQFIRTEQALSDVASSDALQEIYKKHPAFYKLYFNDITGIYGGSNPDSLYLAYSGFRNDTVVNDLFNRVHKRYANIDIIKKDVDQMFRYLKYYFPDKTDVPDVYTLISDFAYQMFIFEDDHQKDAIGISLDMFMSPDIPYKMVSPDNTNFSDYITRSWNQDHISKKIADIYVADIVGEPHGHRLLDLMIHNGKALYITSQLLPEKHDSIIHEYTGAQMQWCYDNEFQMWTFFLDQKLFYESNLNKIGKYVYPAPKSPDMPSDAPGRTANFIGWRIIQSYMERYPETTIEQLINLTDSQKLLDKSKYKPKK